MIIFLNNKIGQNHVKNSHFHQSNLIYVKSPTIFVGYAVT